MASIDIGRAVPKGEFGRSRNRNHTVPWTLTMVDAGIAGSLIVVPFFMGGRTPVGQLAFACASCWTSLWWVVHQTLGYGDRVWRGTYALWPMILAIGFVFLQIVPLPPSLIEGLSPHLYEVLPLWSPDAQSHTTLGTWQTLSLTPDMTRQNLALLFSGVLLFAVAVQRIERIRDVERIIRWTAISVSLMAAFGLVQFLTSNGRFFWLFEHVYSRTDDCVKGAFTNRNHFAQFLALGFGSLLWWILNTQPDRSRRSSRTQRFGFTSSSTSVKNTLKMLLVPICATAVLMSFSRGGVLALLVSASTASFLLLKAEKLSRRAFAVLIGCGLVVCLGLNIYGYDALSSRLESAKSLESLSDRSRLWAAASDGFGDHLLCGTGLSSHRFVYPMYLKPRPGVDSNVFYTHAENSYVQIALETGAVGLLLALVSMAFYFFWCTATLSRGTDHRTTLCFAAVLPALLANAVHSATDYIWYVPSCMGVVAILAACACRLYQFEREHAGAPSPARPLPRFVWAGAALVLIAGAGLALPILWQAFRAEAPWTRYLLLERSLAQLSRETDGDEIHAQSESRTQILMAMIKELSAALDARPNWALAEARMAETHRDLFHELQLTSDNPFSMRDIREAVDESFNSLEAAKEWLPVGVGPHYTHLDDALQHAHRAVALGPLQGELYLILAELSFLEESAVPTKSAYVNQAYRVRPHDGAVLFEIGNEMTLAGHAAEALEFLKRSFRCGPEHQERLIQALAGNVPAQVFLQEFHPDADAVTRMVRHYEQPEFAAELDVVLAAHAAACVAKAESLDPEEGAKYWRQAASSYHKLHDPARSRGCLEYALAGDTTNFDSHLALARACFELEDFAESEKHLRWCAQRKPGHPGVEKLLEQAVRKRIATANQAKPMRQAEIPSAGARR